MLKKLIVGAMFTGVSLMAHSVSININENTLELSGDMNLNSMYVLNENSDYYMTAAYLRSEKHETNSNLGSIGAKVLNPYLNDSGLSFGLGIKMVTTDFEALNKSFLAMPLGLFASYHLNEDVHFSLAFDYAPNVLSFADGESFKAYDFKANYQVIDNGFAYIGKRSIKAEYDNNIEAEFDDAIFFGYKVNF